MGTERFFFNFKKRQRKVCVCCVCTHMYKYTSGRWCIQCDDRNTCSHLAAMRGISNTENSTSERQNGIQDAMGEPHSPGGRSLWNFLLYTGINLFAFFESRLLLFAIKNILRRYYHHHYPDSLRI